MKNLVFLFLAKCSKAYVGNTKKRIKHVVAVDEELVLASLTKAKTKNRD